MADGAANEAARVFARYLAALWDAVGRPSPYRLEKISGARHRQGQTKEPIKRSTVYDHLRGERLKVPQWRMVHELLQVCRQVADDDKYVDLDILGSDEEWRIAWRESQKGGIVSKPPGQLQPVEIPPARIVSPLGPTPASSPQGRTPIERQDRSKDDPAPASRPEAAVQGVDNQHSPPVAPTTDPPSHPGQPALPISHGRHILYAPEMGEEGGWITVVKWFRQVDEHVNRDDRLVHVRTHTMIDLVLSAPNDGILRQIFASEKAEIASGDPLCEIS